jgi:ATP-dependent Lhr-like helicase
VLSLGPQHSFPLADVFRYLIRTPHAMSWCRLFSMRRCSRRGGVGTRRSRWRCHAIARQKGAATTAADAGRRPSGAAFPDAAACLENIPGDRQIPDHPLVSQTVRDCLQEAMDFEGFARVLGRIHRNEIALIARDTPSRHSSRTRFSTPNRTPSSTMRPRGAARTRCADATGR